LEGRRDEVAEQPLALSAGDSGSQTVLLTEEWPSPRGPLDEFNAIRPTSTVSEVQSTVSEVEAESGFTEPIKLTIHSPADNQVGAHNLRSSFTAISRLRAQRSAGEWIEAAGTLKRDAVRLRNTRLARHSAVLLALADALTFTEPSDPTLDQQATTVFDHSLSLLREPFVSEPAEEAFLVDLLSHGWNLAPSTDTEPPEE
jgi:hypothetical protein